MSAPTYAWLSLRPEGRRLVAELDDGEITVNVKTRTNGAYKRWRIIRDYDERDGTWTIIVLDDRRSFIGQVFGRTVRDADKAMNALLRHKGISMVLGRGEAA